ncbi:TonB-dependent receptor [Thermophagus sp. OGC60D27]|uniref:TonB-dependent receptor n=1 Tax=Thermophagus sp. OGC60D27 TaxID=3458415 RepID=UPI004037BB74
MKIATIFLIFCGLTLSAKNTKAQKSEVTLKVENATILDIFRQIEESSHYGFFFKNDEMDLQKRYSLNVEKASLEEVLRKLLGQSGYSYQIVGENVVVTRRLESSLRAQEDDKMVNGTVSDKNGEPIPGVNIVEKGTTNGVITDMEGNFSIVVQSENPILQFSFIGFNSVEVPVTNHQAINIVMKESSISLDEVVAVGYGTQKKVTVTGSVASSKGEELVKVPTSSVTNTMIGRLPGLIANNRSGEPGYDDAELLIRGRSTTGDNSPLVVVDGVADRAGGFARIDPNDIESISILKDASAAIYGSRAANGVILVTTKRGSKGTVKVDYSMNFGLKKPTVLPEMAESWQFAEMINEIETGIYQRDPMYTEDQINLFRNGEDPNNYPNVNALNDVLKDWSTQTRHNLSASGGGDVIQYYFSLGYQFDDNYYENSGSYYEQYNLRSNVDIKASENLKFKVNLAARQEDRYGNHYSSEWTWRYLVKYDPRANIIWPGTDYPVVAPQDDFNALTAVNGAMGYQDNKTSYFNADLRFEWDLPFVTDGLSLAGGIYVDRGDNFYKHFQKAFYLYEKLDEEYVPVKFGPSNAALYENMNQNLGVTSNFRINYEKSFNELHNLNAFVAYEQYESRYDYLYGSRQDYVASNIDQLFAGDQTTAQNDGTASESARQNYFGRIDYNFSEKYLFQFNWRYDGSENFPEGKRFGFFPGVSAGWRISEESFWKNNLNAIDYFKLRGSWGQMGNDRISRFQYMTTYTFDNPAILGGTSPQPQTGVWQNRTGNPNVTWEVATTTNIGFDSRFLKRFTLDVELFQTKRKDILATRNAAIPEYSGLSLPDENIGEAEAKGFEASLGFSEKFGEFHISASANYSFVKSEITYMDEPEGVLDWQSITGKSIGANWFMYEADGIFNTEEELNSSPHLSNASVGDIKFKDIDKNGIIDGNDKIRPDKTSTPEIIYGFNLNVDWRQWSLSTLWQGASNVWQYIFWESGTIGNFTKDFYENRWTETNQNASYPRVYDRQVTATGYENTFWLKDASYLRLKNIQLAYTLPEHLISRLPIDNLRLYVSGYNLLTFTGLKNTDPETTAGDQGFAAWSTPQSKVINFGINLSF